MIALSFAGVLHDRVFFENNFADLSDVVQVKKKKIKISSSRWWRFQLATSPILLIHLHHTWLIPCERVDSLHRHMVASLLLVV